MALSQEAEKMPLLGENAAGRPFSPELLALKRHNQFCEFLRNELEACRTKTERDVVLSALLTAHLHVRQLEEKLPPHFRAEG